jgi:hypothetical protein
MPAGGGLVMRRFLLLVIAAVLMIGQPGTSAALDLQPHRAVYRMVLAGPARHSEVVSANGVMIYRFARACDGWTVENRTFLRLLYDNDVESDTLWSFASWEALDGSTFRFHARYDQDGKTIEKLDGQASLNKPGGPGTASFAQSETKIALPEGTVFPTAHVRDLIAAAGAGRHHFNRVVFDGASADNPYVVNALFGPLPKAETEALANRLQLPVQPAWWTRMAFYPIAKPTPEPEFEMAAHYRADGIADAIVQHFETFSLDVRLRTIELLSPPDC